MPEIEPQDPNLKFLTGIHLWHAPMSSCSQRVRITLAESDRSFQSHLILLEKNEHATPEYQKIHPKGLVPALVEDGRLYIESVDIIRQIAGPDNPINTISDTTFLAMADAAQLDLKLLTFEFLFRGDPPQSAEAVEAFQKNHKNDWLRQFYSDFANGFEPDRLNAAIARTDEGFQYLNSTLSDGRAYLEGDAFTLSDIAWMPNVHRFHLMGWPFERTPFVEDWFVRVSARPSYQTALVDWQPEPAIDHFAKYTKQRQAAGTDVRSFPHFFSGD